MGAKLLLSGGGRCNLTHTGDLDHLVRAFGGSGRFLYGAFSRFGSDDIRALLAAEGVPTKVDEEGRVFPADDRARSVVDALERAARRVGTVILTGTRVERVEWTGAFVVTASDGRRWRSDRVILATGGASYPAVGTTGDGYRWLRALGHTIEPLRPALVPLETEETWPARVRGVALRGVEVSVYAGDRVGAGRRGDVLFTHFGLSGPAVLDVSHEAVVAAGVRREDGGTRGAAAGRTDCGRVILGIRLDPGQTPEAWRERLDAGIRESPRRLIKNVLGAWWPQSLAEVLCAEAGVDPDTQAGQVPREARERLAAQLCELRLSVKGPRPLEEAIVTAGGVSLREVDPRTMASRLVPGLYITGELLDVDGPTGGYNLQAAFSTGWVAGEATARLPGGGAAGR
ncbi:MAG: NAD(P)/FAD-dependent oxidoreductase [Firmicutes bacterium]|nr:NAD(P)/FAD-dependent oxidoreductase [Bacillota bacterium]